MSAADCNLCKLLVAGALYPNYAVPDEHNSGRKASDVLFHTRRKK